jgi:hypothetical protein
MIERSHTIIVLIDGLAILKRLKSIEDNYTLDDDIDQVIDIVARCLRRPLQFVLTKHDLLTQYSLGQIRGILLENPAFSNIITTRRRLGIPTQLIPVSAVGENFAEWDPISRTMKKRRGARAQPYNIDLTLCFAITDALLTRLQQNAWPSWLKLHGSTLGYHSIALLDNMLRIMKWGTILVDDIWLLRAVTALQAASSAWRENAGDLHTYISEKARSITDQNSAIAAITEIQQRLRYEFISNNPESNLLI